MSTQRTKSAHVAMRLLVFARLATAHVCSLPRGRDAARRGTNVIIQCQQCNTRFKVGDDKLAGGPIRVRCSKCNFVFMASKDAATTTLPQPRSNGLGQTSVMSMPPVGAPQAGGSAGAGPVTKMSTAFDDGPSPSGAGGSGFASPQNRSGICRAPTGGPTPGVAQAPDTQRTPMPPTPNGPGPAPSSS